MKTNAIRMLAMGVSLILIGGAPALALAAETQQKAQPPAAAEKAEKKEEAAEKAKEATETPKTEAAEKPAGLVGKIVAVSPESRTVVVDVPLGKEVLRVGAEVTNRTKIVERGKKASLATLKEGQRVRINFRRIATGDEALSLDILRAAKG